MDKQYLAINGALFFWLLALIALVCRCKRAGALAAACALIAFLLHSQRNKINAMFIKKIKRNLRYQKQPRLRQLTQNPKRSPAKTRDYGHRQRVHFVGNIVASGHVYIHGQVTGNIEAKEHLIKVMREGRWRATSAAGS